MGELVIFGAGDLARWIRILFERHSEHEPVAFTVNAEHAPGAEVEGLPVVAFEELAESHPPDRCSLFVASGYRQMNELRAEVCPQARECGYELPNVVCPTASVYGDLGDNVAVSPGAIVMPYATVGSGTILCAGVVVSHDAAVGEYCYLAGQASVYGRARVGDRCLIGADATIRNGVSVGQRSVIGAGTVIMKDAAPDSVYSVPGTPPRDILSSELDDL